MLSNAPRKSPRESNLRNSYNDQEKENKRQGASRNLLSPENHQRTLDLVSSREASMRTKRKLLAIPQQNLALSQDVGNVNQQIQTL